MIPTGAASAYHDSWSDGARRAFEAIVAAHGGWDAWRALDVVTFELRRLSGLLIAVKGYGRTFQRPDRVDVYPRARRVEFRYGTHTDRFEDGAVSYGAERTQVADGRSLFRCSTFERWYPQHSAYFFGYAFANYFGYPFILPPFELIRHIARGDGHSFVIAFPDGFHTHSRVQRFDFDASHLLRRHDYRAEVAGPFVFGAHYTRDYAAYRGIQIARIRDVRPRLGPIVMPISGIFGQLDLID